MFQNFSDYSSSKQEQGCKHWLAGTPKNRFKLCVKIGKYLAATYERDGFL